MTPKGIFQESFTWKEKTWPFSSITDSQPLSLWPVPAWHCPSLVTWSLSHQPAEFWASSSWVWTNLQNEASLAPFSFPLWICVQKHERPEPDMLLSSLELNPWVVKESLYTIMQENKRRNPWKYSFTFLGQSKVTLFVPRLHSVLSDKDFLNKTAAPYHTRTSDRIALLKNGKTKKKLTPVP